MLWGDHIRLFIGTERFFRPVTPAPDGGLDSAPHGDGSEAQAAQGGDVWLPARGVAIIVAKAYPTPNSSFDTTTSIEHAKKGRRRRGGRPITSP